MPSDTSALAAEVLSAREESPPRLLVEPFRALSVKDAYDIQQGVISLRIARGQNPIGYKVGCTSDATQAQLGIDTPIRGVLFDKDHLTHPTEITRDHFAGLAIEGELAVTLNCDPRELSNAQDGIQDQIERIFPVIELHHAGKPQDLSTASVLVANNAIHAGFIASPEVSQAVGQEPLQLTIEFNGDVVAQIEHNPLEFTIFDSLAWLGRALKADRATVVVKPPVTVLCGTVAPLFRIDSPTDVNVTMGTAGTITCRIG